MLGAILIVVCVLGLVGVFPKWRHSREWGYGPTGAVGTLLLVIILFVILGRL